MAEVEIIGIRKDNGNHDNPHEAVSHYEWVQHANGESAITTRQEMVQWIDDGNAAFVERARPRAYCYVNESRAGTRFLQTRSDQTEANNLLRLPEI